MVEEEKGVNKMLYNIELKRVRKPLDCINCPHFNNQFKKCEGLNKTCFLYDEKTQTIIDGVTKLPLKIKKGSK